MGFRIGFAILVGVFSNGCSLYQSDGRKFLEKNALEFSAQGPQGLKWSFKALQVNEPCAELVTAPSLNQDQWSLIETSTDERLLLYQAETGSSFDVLMHVNSGERHFICVFSYSSLQQRLDYLEEDMAMGFQNISQLQQSHYE